MHAIRLRDPWEIERIDGSWLFRRKFQQPTNLPPSPPVTLEIEATQSGQASLNGILLGKFVPHVATGWPIENWRPAGNEIAICFELAAELSAPQRRVPGELLTGVRLLIPETLAPL